MKKMEIQIKRMTHHDMDDFTELIDLFENVFDMRNFVRPDDEHLQNLLMNHNFLVLVAKADNKVLGGLTMYILDQYYSTKPLAYISDLAVLREYQRQGVGGMLIRYLTDYCRENNFEEVFVQADRVDDYALNFYRQTKPTAEEDVVHFYYSLSPLK